MKPLPEKIEPEVKYVENIDGYIDGYQKPLTPAEEKINEILDYLAQEKK